METQISFQTYNRSIILSEFLMHLAKLEQEWVILHQDLPAPSVGYYKRAISNPLEFDKDEKYVISTISDKIVGFGRINWKTKGENTNRCSFKIHFDQYHREIGLYKRMILKMLNQVPEAITLVDF